MAVVFCLKGKHAVSYGCGVFIGISVKKGNTELLDAINAVLAELLVKDANGQSAIEKMVMDHMGMN